MTSARNTTPTRPSWRIRLVFLILSVVAMGSTTLLILEHLEARAGLPGNREKLEALEAAVREDATVAPTLHDEYIRQRDATLELRSRRDALTYLLIASSILLVGIGKLLAVRRGGDLPDPKQIEHHRGDRPKRRRRKHRRQGATPKNAPSPVPIDLDFVDRVIEQEGISREAAIPILQRIQSHFRYLPDEALTRVCERTEITPAQIAGVSSFYAQFRRSPVGRFVVKVCHGTACHVAGATAITDEIRRHLKIAAQRDTDPDGVFTIDEVACVGCCSLAPVLVLEDETLGGLNPADATVAIETYREEHDG